MLHFLQNSKYCVLQSLRLKTIRRVTVQRTRVCNACKIKVCLLFFSTFRLDRSSLIRNFGLSKYIARTNNDESLNLFPEDIAGAYSCKIVLFPGENNIEASNCQKNRPIRQVSVFCHIIAQETLNLSIEKKPVETLQKAPLWRQHVRTEIQQLFIGNGFISVN